MYHSWSRCSQEEIKEFLFIFTDAELTQTLKAILQHTRETCHFLKKQVTPETNTDQQRLTRNQTCCREAAVTPAPLMRPCTLSDLSPLEGLCRQIDALAEKRCRHSSREERLANKNDPNIQWSQSCVSNELCFLTAGEMLGVRRPPVNMSGLAQCVSLNTGRQRQRTRQPKCSCFWIFGLIAAPVHLAILSYWLESAVLEQEKSIFQLIRFWSDTSV